jgi:ABC-type polysaccharide transport system permease subunit
MEVFSQVKFDVRSRNILRSLRLHLMFFLLQEVSHAVMTAILINDLRNKKVIGVHDRFVAMHFFIVRSI